MRHAALSLGICLVAWAPGAQAAPDDPEKEESIQVVIRNRKDAEGNPKGCHNREDGQTQPRLDGTKLAGAC